MRCLGKCPSGFACRLESCRRHAELVIRKQAGIDSSSRKALGHDDVRCDAMAEDGKVKGEVTRTTACRAKACRARDALRLDAQGMLGRSGHSRAFELMQVHLVLLLHASKVPQCLHAKGWGRES